jgi:hypothetical protein
MIESGGQGAEIFQLTRDFKLVIGKIGTAEVTLGSTEMRPQVSKIKSTKRQASVAPAYKYCANRQDRYQKQSHCRTSD